MANQLMKRVVALENIVKQKDLGAMVVFTEPDESAASIRSRVDAMLNTGKDVLVVPKKRILKGYM
ncbi:MAG: hypothetical protein PF441_00380 [Desulfuromusa sp.]|jgi:ribosomal protein S24E|nr:hypothetical protein [Desulfuromusa sp.]